MTGTLGSSLMSLRNKLQKKAFLLAFLLINFDWLETLIFFELHHGVIESTVHKVTKSFCKGLD